MAGLDMEQYTLRVTQDSSGNTVRILTDASGDRIELSMRENVRGKVVPYAEIYQHDLQPIRADEQLALRAASLADQLTAQAETTFLKQTPDSTWMSKAINDRIERKEFSGKLASSSGVTFNANKDLIGQLVPTSALPAKGYDPRSTPEADKFGR